VLPTLTSVLRCCREGDMWHGGAVEASGCVRNTAGFGSVPAGISAESAVRITRYVPSVQQDGVAAVPCSPAIHLLRAAEWLVAAAQLRRLRRYYSTRRQHTARRPRPSRCQHVGSTRRRRTAPLPRFHLTIFSRFQTHVVQAPVSLFIDFCLHFHFVFVDRCVFCLFKACVWAK